MKMSRVIINNSYLPHLFLLSVSFIALITAPFFSYPVDFKKGIEIIRGNGYYLIDGIPFDEFDDVQYMIIQTDFNSFLNICKRLNSNGNLFAVSVDQENRVIFIYELESSVYHSIVYCCKLS